MTAMESTAATKLGEQEQDTYMLLPDVPVMLSSLALDDWTDTQLPHAPKPLAEEALPSAVVLPEGSTEVPKDEHPIVRGIRRSAEWYEGSDEFLGKRHKKNQPEGVPDDVWTAGVSMTPQPGWHKLCFIYAPREAWKKVEVYAHSSTTVGDVKVVLEPVVRLKHNAFACFGMESQRKLPYTESLIEHSWHNREPLEPRICVPTRSVREILQQRYTGI